MARAHQAVYETASVAADPSRWRPALAAVALFVALAPRSPMQQSLLASTAADRRLEELPEAAALLRALRTNELIAWPQLAAALEPVLAAQPLLFGPAAGEAGAKRRADLALRVTEHNMHVVARYYSRLSLTRLAQLLSLSPDAAEERFGAMVSAKAISAKLDRPAGVITFARPGANFTSAAGSGGGAEELLNAWAAGTEKLLGLVEVAVHKMSKDATTARITLTAA